MYRDKVLVISWTDNTPHTSGNYLILRTVGSQAQYDDVQANKVSLSYLHGDHLGSNSLMTDAAGAVVPNSQAAYLPFGDWRNEPSTANLTDLGYTGHRHNNTVPNDLGLIYMNARYYMPSLAKFASADSIIPDPANPQSYNRYSYGYNNPVKYSDPSGHLSVDEIEEYFGYSTLEEAFEAWGQELFDLLWDTPLTWGSVFNYDDNNAMLVLIEAGSAGSGEYVGGFWGLDGGNSGEQVWEYEFKNSDDVDYNPGLTEYWGELGYQYLPTKTGTDGYNYYDPVMYSQLSVGHLSAGATAVGLLATAGVGFACVSNPAGWVVCMGGVAGLIAGGATVSGAILTVISPPNTINYPLLNLPTLGGNPPISFGFFGPTLFRKLVWKVMYECLASISRIYFPYNNGLVRASTSVC